MLSSTPCLCPSDLSSQSPLSIEEALRLTDRDRAQADRTTALGHLHVLVLWEGPLTSAGGVTGIVCITPYYMSTPQCLELAYPPERARERETKVLYRSNKVHLKLIKTTHKKTLALFRLNLKTSN